MSILRLKDENGNWQDVPAIIGPQGEPGKDGVTGADGKSAYQIWLDAGNTGTEADFLASLVGPQGPEGKPGEDGVTPDLSDVVKFVNNIGPDDNGNVEIEYEGFKVYHVKDGFEYNSRTTNTVIFKLTENGEVALQKVLDEYLKGNPNTVLILDTYDNNNYIKEALIFVPYVDKSSSTMLYLQTLTTPYAPLITSTGNGTVTQGWWWVSFMVIINDDGSTGSYSFKMIATDEKTYLTSGYFENYKHTINAIHTYNKLPQSSVEPTDDKDLVNKAYADSLGSYGIKVIDNKYRNNIAGYSENGYLNLDMLYTNNPNSEVYVVGESTLTFRPNEMYGNRSLKAGSLIVVYNNKYGIIFDFSSKFNYFIVNGSVKGKSLDDTYFNNLKELNFLPKDNSKTYTPTSAYHPATKQYVDNLVGDIESLLSEV